MSMTIKAFASWGRDNASYDINDADAAVEALAELARILGETERGAHAVIIHHEDAELELDRRAEWAPVTAILAESLAAFVTTR